MTEKRTINIKLMVRLAHEVAHEQAETGVISADAYNSGPCVHVVHGSLQEVAPVSDWVWTDRSNDVNPHNASVMVDGVEFFAIFTDEEKAEALSK